MIEKIEKEIKHLEKIASIKKDTQSIDMLLGARRILRVVKESKFDCNNIEIGFCDHCGEKREIKHHRTEFDLCFNCWEIY